MRRCFVICEDRPREDRPREARPLRFLLASLARHCPAAAVRLYYPPADDDLAAWIDTLPGVVLRRDWPGEAGAGWNVKPDALLDTLADFDEAVWLDSDLVLAGDIRPLVDAPAETVAVAEEPAKTPFAGDAADRCRAWGWPVGRPLAQINSSVLRLTRRHLGLLGVWRHTLRDDRHRAAHRLPVHERPFWCAGDQDVLAALLASEQFATLPLRLLRSGRDIVHESGPAGWSLRRRLLDLGRTLPAVAHACGRKPWEFEASPPWRTLRHRAREALGLEKGYLYVARGLLRDTGLTDREVPWLNRRTALGRAMTPLDLGRARLRGLPLAVVKTLLPKV